MAAVVVILDAKGTRSLAAAASWADLSASKFSSGPKRANRDASHMYIRESIMLGKDPKEAVDGPRAQAVWCFATKKTRH